MKFTGYHIEFKFTYSKSFIGFFLVFIYALYDMSMELVAVDRYTKKESEQDINIYS